MLSILDRYIIRKFLSTFFFMLGIIMLFAMVFDISEKLSEFISNKAPISAIFTDYYLNFLLFYGNMFSSMIIFISVIWFTAKLAQDTEIVPMWFSGRPITRFLRPYIIGATILMIISLILNHFIVPRANKIRLDFEEKYYRDVMLVEDYHAEYPGNQLVYFSNYSNSEDQVHDLTIQTWNDSNQPLTFLKARLAKNYPGTNKWQLTDYYEKTLAFPKGKINQGAKKDTVFQFKIDEMAQRENVAESMTFNELRSLIKREKQKGSANVPFYEIELHQRTSYPFAAYILTIIGVSVSSQKKRGGIGMNIAIGLGFVFVYIFAMKMMTVASLNVGFPAIIAVWIPNMLFSIVAYFLYRFSQK
jgi:lipopolysaccharide export system permease protein